MVIDTSALMAILLDEPEADPFGQAIENDPIRLISAGTFLECSLVLEARFGEPGAELLDELVRSADCDVVPVTLEQAKLARGAFRRFGKGRHPAGLNFGDCFAFALALSSGEPLLFKGNDFARTDLPVVAWR